MNSLDIFGLDIRYKYNPRLKNSYINILPSTQVVVKTPVKSEKYIYTLIENKYEWIIKKIDHIKKYEKIDVNIEDEVLIFGEVYSIDHEIASSLKEKLQKLRMPTQKNILISYDKYYKEMAQSHIPGRVEYFSTLMELYPANIKFRKMKKRWGSCDSKKELTFNTNLLKLSCELIDYVIVHELAHIKYMNHSKQFHNLVNRYLIDSKKLEKRIREQYYRL
ncbi:M48 family metallopeptidase [Sulfurimonas sp. HSL-1716]|uniref:M48 family metallopeptidase n=1 Tax=Hydrocurvibacter sulfurireducens TaxID=3131937 RepID=UPI0031F81732